MNTRAIAAVLFAIGSVTANAAEPRAATPAEIAAIREDVETKLNDAESARFNSVKVTEDGTVCGLVNAKNRMGAYVGYQPFTGMVFDHEGKISAYVMGLDSPEASRTMCADRGVLLPL